MSDIPEGMYKETLNKNQSNQFYITIPNQYTDLKVIFSNCKTKICRANSKSQNTHDEHSVIIKKLSEPFFDKASAEQCLREIKYLNHAQDSEYIINILKIFKETKKENFTTLCLVTEDAGCSISYWHRNNGAFPYPTIKKIASHITYGLKYLHDTGLVHRDIKPENICYSDKTGIAKIIDLGLARSVYSQKNYKNDGETLIDQDNHKDISNDPTDNVQTINYKAPEIILEYHKSRENAKKGYGYSIDMWSFGLILIEMITGCPVFEYKEQIEHIEDICGLLGRIPYFLELEQFIKIKYKVVYERDFKPTLLEMLDSAFDNYRERRGEIENAEEQKTEYRNLIEKLVNYEIVRPTAAEILGFKFFDGNRKNMEKDLANQWTRSSSKQRHVPDVKHNKSTRYYRNEISKLFT